MGLFGVLWFRVYLKHPQLAGHGLTSRLVTSLNVVGCVALQSQLVVLLRHHWAEMLFNALSSRNL